MFDINNSRDFYQKLLEDFDDFMGHQDSARHGMNCAITAHHMADWVWVDFLKTDAALRMKMGIKNRSDFKSWIDSQSVWYAMVQDISNGSKHFLRDQSVGTARIGGYGQGGYGMGPYGMGYLTVDLGGSDPTQQLLPFALLLEVVIRFWRDFLNQYGPYKGDLPEGKTQLSMP
jgi:hypothetical protein